MKKLLLIPTMFFIIAGFLLAQDYHKKCLEPVVLIQAANKTSSGSAVVVKSKMIEKDVYLNTLFSCNHIFDNTMYTITMNYDSGFVSADEVYAMKTIYKSMENDIAIACFVSNKKINEAEIDFDSIPSLKEGVFAIGCGLGDPPRHSEGFVIGLGPRKDELKDIQTSIYIVPGDSGSPLFYKNRIIGITSAIRSYNSNGQIYPANGISLFKSAKLFKPVINTEKYKFIFEEKEVIPKILIDYLWLIDGQIKND